MKQKKNLNVANSKKKGAMNKKFNVQVKTLIKTTGAAKQISKIKQSKNAKNLSNKKDMFQSKKDAKELKKQEIEENEDEDESSVESGMEQDIGGRSDDESEEESGSDGFLDKEALSVDEDEEEEEEEEDEEEQEEDSDGGVEDNDEKEVGRKKKMADEDNDDDEDDDENENEEADSEDSNEKSKENAIKINKQTKTQIEKSKKTKVKNTAIEQENSDDDNDPPTEVPISKKEKGNEQDLNDIEDIQSRPIPPDVTDDRIIFIKNLPRKYEFMDIAKVFSKYGKITHFVRLNLSTPHAAAALMAFNKAKAAKAALAADEVAKVFDRTLTVSPKRSRSELSRNLNMENKAKAVYISKLNPTVTEADLREHFEYCGNIVKVTIVKRNSNAFAFINFENEESAKEAKKLNNSQLNGETINVSLREEELKRDPKLTLIVKNNKSIENCTEERLKEIFEKCGEIQYIAVINKKTVLAFITFANEAGKEKAFKLNNTKVGNIQLELAEYQSTVNKLMVFVQHLAPGTSKGAVHELMSQAGEIESIVMKNNFAIVRYKDTDAFCKSFLLNETILNGNMVFLEPYSEKKSFILKRLSHMHDNVGERRIMSKLTLEPPQKKQKFFEKNN